MHYLQVKKVSFRYRDHYFLQDVDFSLQYGQKVGLVARNGMGKSTFLRLLTGELECSEGEIVWNSACRVVSVSQQPTYPASSKVRDLFINPNGYEDWHYQVRYDTLVRELNLEPLLDSPWGTLSGGEQKKIALCVALVQDPDVLILDEPTNHLDLDMIAWLGQKLMKKSLTLLMVTHDRYFLEHVCDSLIELDHGKLFFYSGNYAHYLLAKSQRMEKETKDMHHMTQLYRRELAWVKKAPRARESKSVKRTKDFFSLQEKFHQQTIDYKKRNRVLSIELSDESRSSMRGDKILHLQKITKTFLSPLGEKKIILSDFSHEFHQGERIGILGKNGVGKTTFLQLLLGEEVLDAGRRELASQVVFGYYSQEPSFPDGVKVIDYIKSIGDFLVIGGKKVSIQRLLQQFLFSPVQQQAWIQDLSGGEKKRLYLLATLLKNPNFLILDEPTNDLDIETMNALEEFLLSYQGCLIVVSHDRYFIDKIATSIFDFRGDGVIEKFQGGYTAYLSWSARNSKALTCTQDISIVPEHGLFPPKKGLTKDEKKELDRLMREIAQGEERKNQINILFQTQQLTQEELKILGKELQQLSLELEQKEARRLELSECIYE